MKRKYLFLAFILLLRIISVAQDRTKVQATYEKCNGSKNNFIYLNKNGTFLTQLLGGCDGRFETQGKWTINKDTLNFTSIESRIMDAPWKRTQGESNYLINKQTLVSFSIVENKMVIDSNEIYKKIKNKK